MRTRALTAALVLAATMGGWAETTWISTSSGTFSTAANWNNGLPSTGPQLAIFQDSDSIQHVIDITGTARNTVGMRFDLFTGGAGFVFNSSAAAAVPFQVRATNLNGTGATLLNNDDSVQTFNVPMSMFNPVAGGGISASQTWVAAAGDLIFSGIYSGTRATITNGGGRLTIDGNFNTTIGLATGRGDIRGAGGLTKNGSGTLTLGGNLANDYSGGTVINSGTVVANKVNALGTGGLIMNGGTLDIGANSQTLGAVTNAGGTMNGTATLTGSAYEMLSGVVNLSLGGVGVTLTKRGPGTVTLNGISSYTGATRIEEGILRLGGNNRISSSSRLQLAGGTLDTGGNDQTFDTLDLDAFSSIDFGSGQSDLVFADSDLEDWGGSLLTLLNFTVGEDTLRVGTDGTGFDTQLSLLRFSGYGDAPGQIDANGFITPVPEPSAVTLALLGGLAFLATRRRRTR